MRTLATLPENLHKRILEKKKKLDSYGRLPEEVVRKIEEFMQIEFVYNSNKIAGNSLTRGETALILRGMTVRNQNLLEVLKGKNLTDIMVVQNHPSALQFIKELAFDVKRKITEDDIKKIHRLMMTGVTVSAGKYRQLDLGVVGARFISPLFYRIPTHMKDLVEFINENPDELRPIELAARAHYYLAWIAPFEDGNGRVSRLLLNFILARHGYRSAVIKNVERKTYLESLRRAGLGDFELFLIYVARCVEQTLDMYLLELKGKKA